MSYTIKFTLAALAIIAILGFIEGH